MLGVGIVFLAMMMRNLTRPDTQEISFQHFKTQLLAKDVVDRIEVANKTTAKVHQACVHMLVSLHSGCVATMWCYALVLLPIGHVTFQLLAIALWPTPFAIFAEKHKSLEYHCLDITAAPLLCMLYLVACSQTVMLHACRS